MPISGGAPGLTFNFEREVESVPGTSTLVLGDAKILTAFEAQGSTVTLERQNQAGNWDKVDTPDGGNLDAITTICHVTNFVSIEAAQWRLENGNAAARNCYMSVINVG